MKASTIAAIATPYGRGGIGIVKISGPEALPIAASVFRKSGNSVASENSSPDSFESHKIYHGHIVDRISGQIVDEVILSVMKAPRSYTREDVVEINAHSGYMVLDAILELVFSHGARLAEPGEFTKRAFLNGRIDLTRAEGVVDIINARTERALQMANAQLKGGLGNTIESIRSALLVIVAEIEAKIDFPEDVDGITCTKSVNEKLEQEVLVPLQRLLKQHRAGHFYRDGVKLAVIGRPNVGKSSLVNRLLRKDRVIVSPVPGTTRDLIEESLDIHGIPVVIADTAGIHRTNDPVEAIGIYKTEDCILDADFVLFMVDAGVPLCNEDYSIYRTLEEKPAILVINKIDLLEDSERFHIPKTWTIPIVMTSALYNQGIDALQSLFAKTVIQNDEGRDQNASVPNLRHKLSLERSVRAIGSALIGLGEAIPEELIAIDLKLAVDALDEITGKEVRPTILDEIFSRFCIGK